MPPEHWDVARPHLSSTVIPHLGTVGRDGWPHVAPVWIGERDGLILVNSREASPKVWNVRHDPRVAISMHVSEEPFLAFTIFGTVVGETTEGAEEHIDELSLRYDGAPWPEHAVPRVILRIRPDRIAIHG